VSHPHVALQRNCHARPNRLTSLPRHLRPKRLSLSDYPRGVDDSDASDYCYGEEDIGGACAMSSRHGSLSSISDTDGDGCIKRRQSEKLSKAEEENYQKLLEFAIQESLKLENMNPGYSDLKQSVPSAAFSQVPVHYSKGSNDIPQLTKSVRFHKNVGIKEISSDPEMEKSKDESMDQPSKVDERSGPAVKPKKPFVQNSSLSVKAKSNSPATENSDPPSRIWFKDDFNGNDQNFEDKRQNTKTKHLASQEYDAPSRIVFKDNIDGNNNFIPITRKVKGLKKEKNEGGFKSEKGKSLKTDYNRNNPLPPDAQRRRSMLSDSNEPVLYNGQYRKWPQNNSGSLSDSFASKVSSIKGDNIVKVEGLPRGFVVSQLKDLLDSHQQHSMKRAKLSDAGETKTAWLKFKDEDSAVTALSILDGCLLDANSLPLFCTFVSLP